MKKRIFSGMCLVAVLAVVLSALLFSWMSYQQLFDQMRTITRDEAGYVVAAIEGSGTDALEKLGPVNAARITYVGQDGTVLYDSEEQPESMENHLEREEVQEALKLGFGDANRSSDTMQEQTYYYAIRMDDGTVVRVSNTTGSVLALFLHSVPLLVVIVIITILVAVVLARRAARNIVQPINDLDLDNPMNNGEAYDELAPFLSRIDKQKQQIRLEQAAQRRQRADLDSITANMREGLVVLDGSASVLSLNRSARRLLHLEEQDCVGKSIFGYCRSKQFIPAVESVLAGESVDTVMELQGRALRLLASPSQGADGTKGAILLLMDVTETYSAEQMRREFSANVSHELKTPLTSISGYAELMMNGMVKSEDIVPFAQRIHQEATRLIALVQDIIRLSRLDEGSEDLTKEPVDLLPLAKAAAEHLAALADDRKVTLTVEGESVTVEGVKPLLEEMLFNLCENAVRYNKPDGSVIVTVGQEKGKAFFSVKDTGIGIPEADRERVFERFYRVDSGRSKQSGGTGLGLSIVKHAAQCHGAAIDLDSRVGKGTTITVRFP